MPDWGDFFPEEPAPGDGGFWTPPPIETAPPPFEGGYPDPGPINPVPTPDPGGGTGIDNPFVPPGGGVENGPGTPTGPGGDAPGTGGGQFDWGAFKLDPQGYLKTLLPLLQAGKLAPGMLDILKTVLPLITSGLTTLNLNNKTADASKLLQEGADKSNQFAIDNIGGAQKNFQPYIDNGAKSNNDLYAMVGNNNMTGKFNPVASAGFSPIKGSMTLADLAKRK